MLYAINAHPGDLPVVRGILCAMKATHIDPGRIKEAIRRVTASKVPKMTNPDEWLEFFATPRHLRGGYPEGAGFFAEYFEKEKHKLSKISRVL